MNDDIRAVRAILAEANTSQSIAGMEANYERLLAVAPALVDEVERLVRERETYRKAVAETLRYEMASVISDTPENLHLREIQRLDAIVARMREVLEWLDRGGGLGYEAHDRIRAALGKGAK